MNFNFGKAHILFLLLLPFIYFINSGCGKSTGFANSGTTNSYNFVYFGSFGSSTINSYYLDSSGSVVVAANAISTGGGTLNVNDFASSIDGKFLFAANKGSNNVSTYTIDPMTAINPGTITYASADATGAAVTSIAVHPNGKFAYLTNSTALTEQISFFNVNQTTGVLNSADTTFSTTRLNATELAFTPNGNYLYVVNRGTSDISAFTVNSVSGALIEMASSPVATGTNPEDVIVHPNGRYLYTLNVGVNRLYNYSISSSGLLAPLTPAYIATGNGPKKIAITPNGKYIFVSNFTDNTVSIYSVNSTTGLPTAISGSPIAAPVGAGVYALAITPDSKYLVMSGDTSAKGYVFQIDDNTGNITQIGSDISLGGSNPRAIKIVPLSATE